MRDSKTTPIENIQRSLGRRIRELRTKHGWTQEQFAGFCGLHRTYMGHVERGEKNVSLSTMLRVANALGVEPSALFAQAKLRRIGERAAAVKIPSRKIATDGNPWNRVDVHQLLEELQLQRKALRQALRGLTRFSGAQSQARA
jgi:transcriptional regulator with XRE-family HTH domain